MANIEYRALLQCAHGLTDLLQHNLSVSDKLLEKGWITRDLHGWVLTARGVSDQEKASRLVSCLADRVKDAAQVFHDFVAVLKEDPFFADIITKINTEHKTLLEIEKPCDNGKDEKATTVNIVETINMLEKQFSSMQRRLQSEMKTNSEVSPETLVDSLTLLPISLRAEYQKFVFDNLKTLEKAESIREIFHHLNLHFTFIDYRLLEFLIDEYGSRRLKQDMSVYTGKVAVFMDETTVQQLMDHWPGQSDIPPHFEKLRAVIDGDPMTYTLRQLDDLRKRVCSMTMLSETILILIGVGRKNSFIVCWVVPSIFVPELKSVMSRLRSFYQREHIFSVTVGTQRLYSIAAEYEERLLVLCREGTGDINEFQYLLSQPGLDPNIYDKTGGTPLWWLSYHGSTELVQLLLQHGAVVDLPNDDEWGDTPLLEACDQDHVTVAAVLIEKGALVNYKNKKGTHPLYEASLKGNFECVELLLNHDAQIDLPRDDHLGGTALGNACQQGHVDVTRLLLERGAAIDYQNKEGASPLYMASWKGHDDIIQLLIERGASIDLPAKEMYCATALCVACESGHAQIVKTLIENGANVNYQTQGPELTPLLLASYHNQTDVLELLINHGAHLDAVDNKGLTSLMLATQNGHASAVQTLLNGKADPNITDKTSGWTAIFFTIEKNNLEIIEMLIKGGAKLDIKDNNGLTAFQVAKAHNQEAVCDLLEKHGSKTTEREITQDQKEQVKKTSQRLTTIFAFLEHTLLRGRAEKREKKKKVHQERESSNIQEAGEQREVAVEAVQ